MGGDRPTPNTQPQERQYTAAGGAKLLEAEVMEEDRAHSGFQTHEHVGLGARACQGTPTPTQRAACSGRYFLRPQWQGGTCLAFFLV